MQASIFSSYSRGENRVTSSILAVMRFLSLQHTARLLGAIMEDSEFELIHFENQPAKGGKGIPDASISSSCRILVETKIQRDTVDLEQLKRHLKRLDGKVSVEQLLVLTPDDKKPQVIEELREPKVVWANFASLDQAIEELLSDNREVISEREEFLLRNLQVMLIEEGLVGSINDVVVLPAQYAWREYLNSNAYVCQEGRVFQKVQYLAFYSSGQIQTIVPQIIDIHDSVEFKQGHHQGRLGEVVDLMVKDGRREEGKRFKVILLSAPNDPETQHLDEPIVNDLRSDSGRVTAFTQNQRYVSLASLKKAHKTSELVGDK